MKHSGVVIGIALVVFAGALAAVIGSRLSDQTLTMLTGAACGAGLAAPLAILAGAVIGAQRAARNRQSTQPQAPIVVVTPQQPQQTTAPIYPAWPSLQPAGPALSGPRQYTILGEETVIDGTDHVWQ
jgi:hypothetical protein